LFGYRRDRPGGAGTGLANRSLATSQLFSRYEGNGEFAALAVGVEKFRVTSAAHPTRFMSLDFPGLTPAGSSDFHKTVTLRDWGKEREIMIRCSTFETPVPTGLSTETIKFESLSGMDIPMRCPACLRNHKWQQRDAWVEKAGH
jgi:hypothetical protein